MPEQRSLGKHHLHSAIKPTLLGGGHTESSHDKEIEETKGVVFYKVKKQE